jgi:hypothetical protein
MKITSFLLLTVMLGLLSSCNDKAEVVEPEGYFNPLSCTKSSSGCGVDWVLTLNKANFPENGQILFNEKVIIDECDPQSYWSVGGETSTKIEFRIRNYADLSGKEKISMRIYDRKDCSLPKTEKSFEAEQPYTLKNFGGEKQVWIER